MNILGHNQAQHYLIEGIRQHRLSPSLLFVGPDGVGKKRCAIELAKCFSCQSPSLNDSALRCCDKCASCKKIDQNNHSDVLIVNRILQATLLREKPETQTAIKIDAVRHLDKFLSYKPLESQRRTVIIDEAHRLTNDSANALLKLLEEPPNKAQLVLIATNEHTLPSTILSRCAILRFRPLSTKTIADWLENEHAVASENAWEIANRSNGSFERALLLKDDDTPTTDLSDYSLDEFFTLLQETNWRKEGRKQAETSVTHLIEKAQKKLEEGDLNQASRLRALLDARRHIDRNVPPKLVLETLYVKLERKL